MKNLSEQIREIFMKLNRQEKMYFGGPPFSEELEREFSNYTDFIKNGLTNKSRTCLGNYICDDFNKIIGYQSSTIMQLANPTSYEKEYIGLENSLNYVQLKKILVNPEYFGRGVSTKLLQQSLDLAIRYNKNWVTDVNFLNERMINFLSKHNIHPIFEWKTPNKTKMYRFQIAK